MSLTLLVENNAKIESFYSLNLSTWLGLETVVMRSTQEAIQFIEAHPEVKLVIIRSKIGKELTARSLLDYRKTKGLKTPFIILGGGPEFAQEAHVPNSLDLRPLIKLCAGALGITAKEMSAKVVPDFFPIPIAVFLSIKKSVTDVYLKKADKFSILVKKNDPIDVILIENMATNGIDHLYVDKLERLAFVNNASLELLAHLEAEKLNEDEQVTLIDKGIELLTWKLVSIGVNEETIQLANKSMGAIREQVKKHPSLAHLVGRLLENKSSYLFLHTQILTYVALHIIKNIDWGTPEQEEKISFICFFHDIVLESDEQAKIKSTTELKLSALPPEKKSLVEKHAMLAGEIVSKFPHAPMSADQIIRQHHGMLNGVGFSEHFGANISPMATVFIVAEEFTRIILQRDSEELDRKDLLRELKAEFPTARFAKILELLQTITI